MSASNYNKIEKAVRFLSLHHRDLPPLETVAAVAGMSPFHFHRIFKDLVGLSPKEFVTFNTVEHARGLILRRKLPISMASDFSGLSSPRRLHELFVRIENMSASDLKNGGKQLQISWSMKDSDLGALFVASTPSGICRMDFTPDPSRPLAMLRKMFPMAEFVACSLPLHEEAAGAANGKTIGEVKLHVLASPFRLKIWQALLSVPEGKLITYSGLAEKVGSGGAARAVGNAVASNPVALLIPCHRVIRNIGVFGNYMWGEHRKKILLAREHGRTVDNAHENAQIPEIF